MEKALLHELSTRLESVWRRCYDPKHHSYKNYGGRGVRICHEWYDETTRKKNSSLFAEWAVANGYEKNLVLDRIDNNGPYSPDNCRWVTVHDNNRNRRSTILIEIGGETKCAKDWCKEFGMPYTSFCHRKDRGWDPVRAIIVPVGKRRPFLCFHKGVHGGCLRFGRNGRMCPCVEEEEMKQCPDFGEYKPAEKTPEGRLYPLIPEPEEPWMTCDDVSEWTVSS